MPHNFPSPKRAPHDQPLAFGGDLSPQRLLNAYAVGIFPWYSAGDPILWWSPSPRMILPISQAHIAKSLHRTYNSGRFQVRIDTAFPQVIQACATIPRQGQDDTWILPEIIQAYIRLYQLGFAHSFETYLDGTLVGGLYGVSLGDYFCGESMFHTVTDASKVALLRLIEFCQLHHFRFIDAQQPSSLLASFGARPIPRRRFLSMLSQTDLHKTLHGSWAPHTVVLLIGGNQGDRQQLLADAVRLIGERVGTVSRCSSIHETQPWGFQSDQLFLNQALVVDTHLSPHQVLHQALDIEQQLGRIRPSQSTPIDPLAPRTYHSRPIDIDLIFYDSLVINTTDLVLPHPRMHLRSFVLDPLSEIAPHYIHPTLRKSVFQLQNDLSKHP